MNRLSKVLTSGKQGVSPYIVMGYPDLEASYQLLRDYCLAGAAFVEFGIPFSDPSADGPVIEAAVTQVVRNGTRVEDILALASRLRGEGIETPLIAMTYANIAYQGGFDGFCKRLAAVGIDGLILPDASLEEAAPIREALGKYELLWIPLVALTSPGERIAAITKTATGFVYVVGSLGTTGQTSMSSKVESIVSQVRKSGTPVAVGFGINTPDDVKRVFNSGAQVAIVGTALLSAYNNGGHIEALALFSKLST